MRNAKIFIYGLMALLTVLVFQAPAHAYIYVTYDEVYTGAQPGGETPWLTALFENPGEDIHANGYDFDSGVLLTLSTEGLVGDEFVSNWYFTFNPDKYVEDLVFSYVTGVEPNQKKNVDWTDAGGFKTTGAGVPLEIKVPYFTSKKKRFGADLTSQILITGIDDLTADDFNFFIDYKDDEYISVAHIQGIGEEGEDSSWVKGYDPPLPTPEPSTWMLLGIGLAALPFARKIRS